VDRSQFVKDGEEFPTVDMGYYKSVQERPGQSADLATAIAISGGGLRASNFGIGIMLGLEAIGTDNGGNALQEVDYISTVSGGGFAGGAYISALFDHHYYHKNEPFSLENYVEQRIADDLTKSYTGVLLRNYFNPKVWFSTRDYGDGLEKAIDDHVLSYRYRKQMDEPRSILLGDLFVPKDSAQKPVRFPMMFSNTSAMGTLAIFPFTPDMLECYMISGYTHRMRIVEQQQLQPFDVPLAVGIKASGSFPVLVPNTTLSSTYHEERSHLHIMDGAMTDNQGYYTAMEVLKQERAPKKVLFVVDADASGNLYTFSESPHSRPPFKVFLSLTASGLYARRATLKKELLDDGEKYGIKPIFLGFHTLLERADQPKNLPERIHIKDEQKRLIDVLKTNPEQLSARDAHILYELLVNIGTKYTMKPVEQELLYLAGQHIVKIKKSEIEAAIIVD
jgi:hypothetical protein